ncbi:hypothetical protein J6590_032225 [Homalodisca vitripennis]|nr:hypothetical protein J6590_032225 [Homalodisca vitripennis]
MTPTATSATTDLTPLAFITNNQLQAHDYRTVTDLGFLGANCFILQDALDVLSTRIFTVIGVGMT